MQSKTNLRAFSFDKVENQDVSGVRAKFANSSYKKKHYKLPRLFLKSKIVNDKMTLKNLRKKQQPLLNLPF